MTREKKLWWGLALVLLGTFFLLGFFGREVYRQAPPIPARIVSESGETLATKEQILEGQRVWQSLGGQHMGSIWGHGAYQAPDWSADWLHREATLLGSEWARERFGKERNALSAEETALVDAAVRTEMRKNTYDSGTATIQLSPRRARVFARLSEYYGELFSGKASLARLRENYALSKEPLKNPEARASLAKFFFWTAWACTTERPETTVTYTNNWPHEPLVGNRPSSANILWTVLSVMVLIGGVSALTWYRSFRHEEEELPTPPTEDPLAKASLTPSMRASLNYLLVVAALLLLQTFVGALTAHYTVEGQTFFGLPLGTWLPYAVVRTWHMQLAVFWIATAFLAAGLFLAPLIGGREPKGQATLVHVLFAALVVVVFGSMAGEWLSVTQRLPLAQSFLFGHQGYEFVELGRIFQIALYVGLILWLFLMLRALWPALFREGEGRTVTLLFAGSAGCIGLFYGAGFAYGADTHLSVMEYWRWWVVHLWVEGFMEVFTTAAIAVFFSRLGLIRAASAGRATLFSTAIFLLGGVPGTFHHLYFSGTPVQIMAVGASFSALEVVPLVLVGLEAVSTARMTRRVAWMDAYRWPIRYFVAVAFWNMVGAGFFGFLINPPLALYYFQGLNTTPVHSHSALFGVYGMLALGLVLLVLRRLRPEAIWNERLMQITFFGFNGGLVLMLFCSLLPIGLLQAWASIEHGLWYARSAEFMQQPLIVALRWARMGGDTLFLVGVLGFVFHVFSAALSKTSRPLTTN